MVAIIDKPIFRAIILAQKVLITNPHVIPDRYDSPHGGGGRMGCYIMHYSKAWC